MFQNRKDAGLRLAKNIAKDWKSDDAIVVGIPRGGVVVANEIAERLALPLELILVKKISHPQNDEVAIGTVSIDKIHLENREFYDEFWLENELRKKRSRVIEMMKVFGVEAIPAVENKVVILVDDGVATGYTLLLAIELLKRQSPRRIEIAIPVCPIEFYSILKKLVDHVYCLEVSSHFQSIGQFYEYFDQVEDIEVVTLLQKNKKARQNRAKSFK